MRFLCLCIVRSIGLWSLPMSSRTLYVQVLAMSADTNVRSGLLVAPVALCNRVGSVLVFCCRIRFDALQVSSTSLPLLLNVLYPHAGEWALRSPAIIVFWYMVSLKLMCPADDGEQ